MKSTFIILAAVLTGFATFAAADTPKIAVYVISSELSNSEKKAFEKEFVNRFAQSKKYIVVDRSDASLNALSNEMATQREGSVDINQISEMGRQAGVRFLCLVDFTPPAFGVYTIEARLLETETAQVPASGIYKIKSIKDIEDIGIGKIVEDIFMQIEGKSKAKTQAVQSDYKNFGSGERWATFALNMTFPGLGSFAIMDDWVGSLIQLGLFGGGIGLAIKSYDGCELNERDNYECSADNDNYIYGGIAMIAANFVYNIFRSATYGKRKDVTYRKYGDFNMAILPSGNGNFNAFLMYNKAF